MADYINTEMNGASSQSYDNADIVIIDAQQDEYSTCSRAKFGWMDVATPTPSLQWRAPTIFLMRMPRSFPWI